MFVFKAAVVGAGTTGTEIAHAIASADVPVVLQDVEQRCLDQALDRAQALWQSQVDAGRLDPGELQRRLALILTTTDYDGFGDVDFVVEAVPEQMESKQAVFAELDAVAPGHAILASSTSSLSVTEIADATSRPDRVVGFHFPGPASVSRLVEVVEGEYSSPETVAASVAFAQAIRKAPIRVQDAPGLVVDRIRGTAREDQVAAGGGAGTVPEGESSPEALERFTLRALVEACLVLEEGVAGAREIDFAMMAGAGIAPPPLTRADQTGLDVVLAELERAQERWGSAFEPPRVLRRLVAQGRLGVVAGQGFFPYPRPDDGFTDGPVKLETRGPVAIAWLANPPANSISPGVVEELRRVWEAVSARAEARVLLVASANPQLFCAGADIKAFQRMDAQDGRRLLDEMHGLLRDLEQSRIVTIAAVNGLAFGGGCELAMACDLRFAAESASFGQPEIDLGIIPGFGGTQRLPRLVGTAQALQMNLSGQPISAQEAYEMGLVNRVAPDHELLDCALGWARGLSAKAPLAVEQIKRVSARADLEAGIAAEKDGFAAVFGSADAREGIAAFVEKRPARFRGR